MNPRDRIADIAEDVYSPEWAGHLADKIYKEIEDEVKSRLGEPVSHRQRGILESWRKQAARESEYEFFPPRRIVGYVPSISKEEFIRAVLGD